MRDFLDGILQFIGTASLSDDEFADLTITSAAIDQDTYDALFAVLDTREAISSMQDKLIAYFKCKGLDVAPLSADRSNIFVGGALES